ncbi:hypothetical protein [Caballeronia calidae]|uniref:hypothetical protein n=1 Tax=Caballeronia calidae TaxID=1777139 RepID=UPI0035B5393D
MMGFNLVTAGYASTQDTVDWFGRIPIGSSQTAAFFQMPGRRSRSSGKATGRTIVGNAWRKEQRGCGSSMERPDRRAWDIAVALAPNL